MQKRKTSKFEHKDSNLRKGGKIASYTGGVSERRGSVSTWNHSGLKNAETQSSSAASVTATQTYDAFGNSTSTTGSWSSPFGYAGNFGYQEDATGLKLLGHRYLDPTTGRFLTRDPAKDGDNWYVYCENDPVNFFDNEGMQKESTQDKKKEQSDLTIPFIGSTKLNFGNGNGGEVGYGQGKVSKVGIFGGNDNYSYGLGGKPGETKYGDPFLRPYLFAKVSTDSFSLRLDAPQGKGFEGLLRIPVATFYTDCAFAPGSPPFIGGGINFGGGGTLGYGQDPFTKLPMLYIGVRF